MPPEREVEPLGQHSDRLLEDYARFERRLQLAVLFT
jgi:hypothetical protein